LLGLGLVCLLAGAPGLAEESTLSFVQNGTTVRSISSQALREGCAREVEVLDYYYREPRRYLACPLGELLAEAFGQATEDLAERQFVFRAADGYTRPADGAIVLSAGGYVALADADRLARGESPFAPIDRRQLDPGPFYVVWQGEGRSDAHRYPWPYQLVAIELVDLSARFPHAVPPAQAGQDAREGWRLFANECISCHAINGDGGRVGPELNVPRSIVSYRPAEQIRAYIRDPQTFRYTTMPSHRHFSEADLDALLAYLRLMSRHQHDPGAPGAE